MIFNDGSQYRVVTDPARYKRERTMYEFRACSAKNGRDKYKDTAFDKHRRDFRGFPSMMYQFPYQGAGSPENQADFFCSLVEPGWSPSYDMALLDTEGAGKLSNPDDFARRWFARVEDRLKTKAVLYVPMDLSSRLGRNVTGDRLVIAPRYSGNANRGKPPSWAWDIHQFTDRGYFPGCSQTGDCNYTDLSTGQILDRCNGNSPKATKRKTNIILLGG